MEAFDIIQEFYKIKKERRDIGLLMMVKDEEKRIHVSLNSVLGFVKALIIYDTGSTDKTIDIIVKFSKKHRLNLYLKKGTFVDFSTSRNVSLDIAELVNVDFLLKLDSNDELRGGEQLEKLTRTRHNIFLLRQEWDEVRGKSSYYNARFIRNRCGYRYKGRVHEILENNDTVPVLMDKGNIVLYHERIHDMAKTQNRFKRDYEFLLQDYREDPTNPRTLFYLAQTCGCLDKFDEVMYYSKLRLECKTGLEEERFHSLLRCGDVATVLKHSWKDILPWYMKAFEDFNRVEPLIYITRYYISQKKWYAAYMHIRMAVLLTYPVKSILFVNKTDYDYTRWHLLGLVAYFVEEYKIGKKACLKAIKEKNLQKDKDILKEYLSRSRGSS